MKAIRLDRRGLLFVFSIFISLSLISSLVEPTKYLKYLLGPLSILAYLLGDFKTIKRDIGTVEIGYLILVTYGISTIWLSNDVLLGFKDLFFISCYSLPFILILRPNTLSDKDLILIFYLYLGFFLVSVVGRDYKGFSISESRSPFEGPESFVFGGFFLYFMMLKDKLNMFIAIVFMFVSLKRIALLGVLAGAVVWLIPYVWAIIKSKRLLLVLGNLMFIILLYYLVDGFFNDIVERYTDKGVAELTLGRVSHYVGVLENIGSSFFSFLLGSGAGSSYELAMQYDYYDRVGGNLHSDTLKIFYEYGLIIFSIFFGLLASVRGRRAVVLSIYMMVLFLTDNVMIYVSVMYFLLLLIKQSEYKYLETLDDTVNCR